MDFRLPQPGTAAVPIINPSTRQSPANAMNPILNNMQWHSHHSHPNGHYVQNPERSLNGGQIPRGILENHRGGLVAMPAPNPPYWSSSFRGERSAIPGFVDRGKLGAFAPTNQNNFNVHPLSWPGHREGVTGGVSLQPSALNIYARNYIPAYQRAINRSPAIDSYSTPLKTIDFNSYITKFSGSLFLMPRSVDEMPAIKNVPVSVSRHTKNLLPSNYLYYFDECLLLEAASFSTQLADFDLYGQSLSPNDRQHNLYNLRVPGLKDDAPRVELGDTVIVRQIIPFPQLTQQGAEWLARNDTTLSGSVAPGSTGRQLHTVVWGLSRMKETLLLRVDNLVSSSLLCNVRFILQPNNHVPLWRAIVDINAGDASNDGAGGIHKEHSWVRHMLFPDSKDAVMQTKLPKGSFKLEWVDRDLNYEQMKAVDSVVSRDYGHVPFLISGVPGSGKTKTVVECALQLLRCTGDITPHILLCAPSNPAADTLALRLSSHLGPREMFRLNGWVRTYAEVPAALLPYTYTEGDIFSLPDFKTMMRYKVVVTTCMDADLLVRARLTNRDLMTLGHEMASAIFPGKAPAREEMLHWTALLVDEAAQATEPAVCIPLTVVSVSSDLSADVSGSKSSLPLFVMAGDQHQLGPRVSNTDTALSVSLFERLFSRPLYADHPFSRRSGGTSKRLTQEMLPIPRPAFTNLTRNYRSHAAILSVPSALFYSDTLIPSAPSPHPKGPVPTWPGWKSIHRWPVLFSCNTSPDEVEEILHGCGGSGLYNPGEAAKALRYAQSLLEHSDKIDYTTPCTTSSPTPPRPITQGEIAVISPFLSQVYHLRKLFRSHSLPYVSIGPLEVFQGLETRFLIICTTRTRSEAKFVEHDQTLGLGIVGHKRRFNVALTRAKEGLIVIGNPEVLAGNGRDESWRAFLGFCARNNCWEEDHAGPEATATQQGAEYWSHRLAGVRDDEESDIRLTGYVSRLERGLLHAHSVAEDENENEEDDVEGCADALSTKSKGKAKAKRTQTRLGARRTSADDYDAAMWTAGMAAEEALRDALGEE